MIYLHYFVRVQIVKHIILVGDNPRQLVLLQHHIRRIDPDIECHITDICHVRQQLARQPADMILIHVTADIGCFPYVQTIRRERLADEVPMFVFEVPLAAGLLETLLNGKNGMSRCNNQ
jgi:hypothetical protein